MSTPPNYVEGACLRDCAWRLQHASVMQGTSLLDRGICVTGTLTGASSSCRPPPSPSSGSSLPQLCRRRLETTGRLPSTGRSYRPTISSAGWPSTGIWRLPSVRLPCTCWVSASIQCGLPTSAGRLRRLRWLSAAARIPAAGRKCRPGIMPDSMVRWRRCWPGTRADSWVVRNHGQRRSEDVMLPEGSLTPIMGTQFGKPVHMLRSGGLGVMLLLSI